MIIWINGGFGSGKTTLAQELHRRLPDAVVYDPEDVGQMLSKWLPRDGDFQHLPSWRELVVATALLLRRHHADTLIVPMSLIRDAYRDEILGGLNDAGEDVMHVFLEVDAVVLRERSNARVTHPAGGEWDDCAREFGMTGLDEIVAAAARQPAGTLILRSDRLTPNNSPTRCWKPSLSFVTNNACRSTSDARASSTPDPSCGPRTEKRGPLSAVRCLRSGRFDVVVPIPRLGA